MNNVINTWYLVAKKDDSKYGYSKISKEIYYTFEYANYNRIYLQPNYDELLVVLKRTCQVVNGD
jgi:hypothetical protein